MSHFVYSNAYLSIGGTDVSAHLKSLVVNRSQETPDDSNMGDTFFNALPGPQRYSVTPVFSDEYADNDLDEDLAALWGTTFAVAWRPVNTTIAAGNPEYQYTGLLTTEQVGGSFGEAATRSMGAIPVATGGLTRDVTP